MSYDPLQFRNVAYQRLNNREVADAMLMRDIFLAAFISVNVDFYAVKAFRFDVVKKFPRIAPPLL